MLITLALLFAGPQSCTETRQECRACPTVGGKRRCSNIGIACQPSVRVCLPRSKPAPKRRPA